MMSRDDMSDSDMFLDQLICEYDDTSMPLPDIDYQPQLLISKVRKHYMKYLIKLLSRNYETNQQLNKNIYLPSAIWRCAKEIEGTAANMCMVVQLYRKNIVTSVKELINDTKEKRWNKRLLDSLHKLPKNEKKTQTSNSLYGGCSCECTCKQKKKRRQASRSPKNAFNAPNIPQTVINNVDAQKKVNEIPVLINPQIVQMPIGNLNSTITSRPIIQAELNSNQSFVAPPNSVRMSVDSQESDDLMLQLEKLFQSDPNDDDLFESALCDYTEPAIKFNGPINTHNAASIPEQTGGVPNADNSIIDAHTNQIKSLDERLASLAGILANVNNGKPNEQTPSEKETPKRRKSRTVSKWMCEEYFLKSRFFELLDEIGDRDRKKLVEVKELLREMFGDDSDNEAVLSPLEETPEFIISCKERIAPWVVKLLTPHYAKGRIMGKALFKALVKHLIKIIFQCSRYPKKYEVNSFVSDFMKTHKMITCEADFQKFRIENLQI